LLFLSLTQQSDNKKLQQVGLLLCWKSTT